MSKQEIQKEIVVLIKTLNIKDQYKILTLARSLASKRKSLKAKHSLLKFVGAISKEDLEIMREAADIDCEKIDSKER